MAEKCIFSYKQEEHQLSVFKDIMAKRLFHEFGLARSLSEITDRHEGVLV